MNVLFGRTPLIRGACFYLRYEVFVLEQKIDPALEFDDLDDAGARYFVLMEKNQPIAAMRYLHKDADSIQPDRFCVAKNSRGKGAGRRLLAAAEQQGIKENRSCSFVVAELSAQLFYEKNGYHVISEPYLEDGIWCISMEKRL